MLAGGPPAQAPLEARDDAHLPRAASPHQPWRTRGRGPHDRPQRQALVLAAVGSRRGGGPHRGTGARGQLRLVFGSPNVGASPHRDEDAPDVDQASRAGGGRRRLERHVAPRPVRSSPLGAYRCTPRAPQARSRSPWRSAASRRQATSAPLGQVGSPWGTAGGVTGDVPRRVAPGDRLGEGGVQHAVHVADGAEPRPRPPWRHRRRARSASGLSSFSLTRPRAGLTCFRNSSVYRVLPCGTRSPS